MAADDAERAIRSHRHTYHFFTSLMKFGAIIAVLTALLVMLIIRN